MIAVRVVVVALAAGYGVHLVYTSAFLGWRGIGPFPRSPRAASSRQIGARISAWIREAGLGAMPWWELAGVMLAMLVGGTAASYAVFGSAVAAIVGGVFCAALPVGSWRARRIRRLDTARDAWPRLIEEMRLLTSSAGRSIPQALFEVGRRAPVELQPAFAVAQREWLLSTDLERATRVLRRELADATADVVCETLLVAHDLGGADVDRHLAALVEDRVLDLQGRKDAVARQAGARFARRFVLAVPFGMAAVGLRIGDGRAAYQTAGGQLAVVVALALVAACWWWAGRIMKLPVEPRVFVGQGESP